MSSPNQQTNWPIILFAVACGVLGAFHVGKVPLALPAIRAEFGLSLASGGLVASILNMVSALFGFVAGFGADRIGHRRAALLGLTLLTVGSLAGGFAASVEWLYVTRFAEGAGFMLVIVASPALIVRAAQPKHVQIALGLWGTYMPAGMAIILLAAPLILVDGNWRMLWWVSGVLIGIFALIYRIGTRSAPPPAPPRHLKDSIPVLRSPGAWLLALTFTLYTAQWMGLMTWLPTILLDDMGMAPGATALITAGAVAISVFGNMINGWILQKGVSHWSMLTIGHIGMGSGAWALFQADIPDVIRLGGVFWFSFLGGWVPSSMFSSVLFHVPSRNLVGTANGMLVQGNNIGSFLGAPILGAMVAAAAGWHIIGTALPAMAGLAIVLAGGVWWLERNR